MKLTWQLMRKSMNTRINHAHMGIRIYIKNDRDESGCVPGPWATVRYQKTRLVIKHKMFMCISRIRVNQSHIANESINQSINHEVPYVGPPPKPIYFAWTKSVNSITRNYKIWFLLILKQFKNKGDENCMPKGKMASTFD